MTDDLTAVFLPTAFTGPAWDRARDKLAAPRDEELPLEALREEMAVRDVLNRFGYALDQCDVDQMARLLADDCVMTHPSGTFSGVEAIRGYYAEHFRRAPHRFHLWSNLVVWLSDDLRRGWATSYFYGLTEATGGSPRVVGGIAADTVAKIDATWKIEARAITADLVAGLPAGDRNG
jgi:uncharacterized protein (TIGR02246 family)